MATAVWVCVYMCVCVGVQYMWMWVCSACLREAQRECVGDNVCLCVCTASFMRTEVSLRPWEKDISFKVRTFKSVLSSGLFDGFRSQTVWNSWSQWSHPLVSEISFCKLRFSLMAVFILILLKTEATVFGWRVEWRKGRTPASLVRCIDALQRHRHLLNNI